VESGEALLVRGANGSGKTTLLRILCGLTAPDLGEVRWAGVATKPLAADQRANCLYLGHANALKDELSAQQNLAHALELDGVRQDTNAQTRALDEAGLAGRQHIAARRLSQGQKRRVGLARLALSNKPVWLLDEPANALDADGLDRFVALVKSHLGKGGMAAIATHLPLPLGGTVRELHIGASA
jgi:heme exporter protein A